MSVDVHFSLDENEPQQRLALAILAAWEQQGYPVDEVIARALLALGDHQRASQSSMMVASVKDILRQMKEVLREAQNLGITPSGAPTHETPAPETASESKQLSQAFLAAVKKAARPGLRLDA